MLVLLAAVACGSITPQAQRGALLVHLLHQASLTHDDVIDKATHRRKNPTINTTWNNKIAVLFGDYLLAKILSLATQHQDYNLLNLIAQATQATIEGEILQLENAHTYNTTEAVYLDIIYKKTAYLFGTCLALGAMAAGASNAHVATLRQAGEYLGIAFQLKDDWLDYNSEELEKPQGMDLQAGLLTLPLIHALEQVSLRKQQTILHILKHHSNDPQKQQEVLVFVKKSKGLIYTLQKMHQYQQKALNALTHLATSSYQQALINLIQHI